MKFGVVRFPGSNCDQDAFFTVRDRLRQPVEYLWHADRDLKRSDVVVLPGGFSYGDYLRCGAIARFAPIMGAIGEHAARGGTVLGICNGFQILCEAHLLPGALVRNDSARFVCRHVRLRVENASSALTAGARRGDILSIPVAHGEGKYVCSEADLQRLNAANQVLLRYDSDADNINGSVGGIAAVANETFNVFGMMPHPERASDPSLGSGDGLVLLQSLLTGAQGVVPR